MPNSPPYHPMLGALRADKPYVLNWVKRCKRKNQQIDGFFYATDPVANYGVDITLFGTLKDRPEDLNNAMTQLKQNLDSVNSMILIVPANWLN